MLKKYLQIQAVTQIKIHTEVLTLLFSDFNGIQETACALWLFLLVFSFALFVKDTHLYTHVIQIS